MIDIRSVTQRDIPGIMALYEQLTEEKNNVPLDQARLVFNEVVASSSRKLLVAEDQGLVLGSLFVQIIPNLTHDARPWAILENMVVDSSHRRRGIGKNLIDYALKFCRDSGCYKVQLLSSKKRKEAHEFYRSLGFEDLALGFRKYFPF